MNENQDWQNQPNQWDDTTHHQPQGPNTLGIVGFIFSFCIPPLGLILSLIALGKRPRGFAIAGTIIGILGSLILAGCAVFWAFFGKAGMMVGSMTELPKQLDRWSQEQGNGLYPDSIDQLSVPDMMLTDAWGTELRYEQLDDGTAWRITYAGPDTQFDTTDDIVIDSEMSEFDIDNMAQQIMQDYIENR